MGKKKVSLEQLNAKLDVLLKNQSKILKEEKKIEREEERLESEESGELLELRKLRELDTEIAKEIGEHPLSKVTIRDVAKGGVGAFVGVVAHFTFFYGIEVAEWLSFSRATALYPISFFIGGVFMYATGFRKVKDKKILHILPIRLIVLYITALLVAAAVLAFFSPEFLHHPELAYRQLSTVTLIAIIGACTADLIGKE